MDIALESLDGLQRQLRVTIPALTLEQRLDSRLAEVAAQSRIPGFRPGKAPLSVLRQRYGQELREEVIEELLKEALAKAEKEQKLHIAGDIRVEAPSLLVALPAYTYVLHFEVFPEIPELDLHQITVAIPQVSIEDQEIMHSLVLLQQEHADWQPVRRDSKEGDRISFEYQIFDQGKLLDSGQKVDFFLGRDLFLTEHLSKSLTGMRAKESKVLDVTLPDTLSDIVDQALLGKSLRFQLTVREVATAQLPPLDDVLAQKEGYANFEALRAAVHSHLQQQADMLITQYVDAQFFHALDAMLDFPLPMSLVAEQMQALARQANRSAASSRDLSPEDAQIFFAPARLQVKERLLMEKLGEQLQVSFDEKAFAESLPYMLPANLNEERLKALLEDKAMIGVFAQSFYLRQVKIAALAQVNKQSIAMSFAELLNTKPFAQLTTAQSFSNIQPTITEDHPNDKND
jgi:trigger factor